MKKQRYTYITYPLFLLILIFTLPFLQSKADHNIDSMLFCESIFLDFADGKYTVSLFCSDAESGENEIYHGNGKNIADCIKKAKNGCAKNIFLTTSQLIVLGNGIKESHLKELCVFAIKENNLPLYMTVLKSDSSSLQKENFEKIADAVKTNGENQKKSLWVLIENVLAHSNSMTYNVSVSNDGKIYFNEG